ncbi:MAG: hypothetical protein J2O48_13405 [Solirubrobacterales bacterium]|nr:hypothetical protein [Solirubrobacterales bacterium]
MTLGVLLALAVGVLTASAQASSKTPAKATAKHSAQAGGQHPAGPRSLVARAGNEQVQLSWAIPAGARNIAGYNVYRNGRRVKTGVHGHYFTDTKLTNGQRYTYTVKAYWQTPKPGGNGTSSGKSGAVVTTLSEPAKSVSATPTHKIFWGATWIGTQFTGQEAPWDWNAVTDFENQDAGGHRSSLLGFGSSFHAKYCEGGMTIGTDDMYCAFPTAQMDNVRKHGVIPVFSWSTPDQGWNDPAFSDAAIASGSQDAYITQWAQAAKAWGHPFMVRLDHEFNGNWYQWGVGYTWRDSNGVKHTNTVSDFLNMWRHVVNVFRSVGANNATFVWCPNIDPQGGGGTKAGLYESDTGPLKSLYPGDKYVDWTCMDGYNRLHGNYDGKWETFSQGFGSTYKTIRKIAPAKPMLIGEIGSTGTGGNKSAWVSDFLKELPAHFPAVRGFTWYETADGNNDPIDGKAPAQGAFAKGLKGSQFVQNVYGGLPPGVIAPPSGT